MIIIKSEREIKLIREACRLTALALDYVESLIKPGITTGELDRLTEEFIRKNNGLPAFKGYHGYPASICASVNDVVIHGIPGNLMLKEGDIIGVDLGVIYRGYYGDSARTFPVGEVSENAKRLMEITKRALMEGIKKAVPGNRVGDISNAVQTVAESAGYSVVREFVGHGVGKKLHEEPAIPNFGRPGIGPELKPNMTIAIEPMINEGDWHVKVLEDGWTVVTVDGSLSAHFEHTILITEEGNEILTL